MSKLNFSLSNRSNDLVSIALPSFRPGNGAVYVGRAKINVERLACSIDVELSRDELATFTYAIQECSVKLRGSFSLKSFNETFVLTGEMAPHGHARISIHARFTLHRQRDESQWSVSTNFACPADSLSKAAELLRDELKVTNADQY